MRSHAEAPAAAGTGASTARTTLLTFASVLGGACLAFATALYLGNTLGDAGTGMFFQVMAFFSIAVVACTFGADTGLVRTLSAQLALGGNRQLRRTLVIALWPVLLATGLLAAALWFGADALAARTGVPGLAAAIRLAAPLLLPAAVMALCFGAMRGTGHVAGFSALQNLVLPALRFALAALAVLAGGSLLQLTAAWTLPVLLVVVLAAIATWRAVHGRQGAGAEPSDEAPRAGFGVFWGFSSARGASALVETLLEWIDVIAVAVFLGPAAAGIYGAVNRCVRLGVMLEHTARLVTGPMMSASLATGDHDGAQRLFGDTAKVLVVCAWPFYLTLAIFGPAVLSLFGPGFQAGAGPLAVICIVMMFAVSAGGVQSMLLMGGKSRWQLLNKACALGVAVALNLWLVPAWGLLGAVTAWSAAVAVDYALATLQVGLSMRFWAPARELLALAVLCLAVFGAGGMAWRLALGPGLAGLGLNLAVGLPAYGFICLKFGRQLGIDGLTGQLRRALGKKAPKPAGIPGIP
ncbi:lipopolysaccharide biosynthesis protein [Paeniglutamicibacter psychrophenolicus]|uniref:lipopolysaccharide biosynthesis protein n=1 Tax=Paeniglutamicibacter psychrophenolicus TaxID=257454 RepID=UPI002780DF62|nr:lipopolysaccharide biosynthesis protein [Paeniglutamicibacter psychrophenolicus]MDQ0092666.1 O-antigen/teichoic acid export membrane protein [Paeniglutamicibacter psychrophenolicus]